MTKNTLFYFCAIAVGFIIIFHLASALGGYPFYRSQHLGAALTYAEHGVDMLRPVMVGFNANGEPAPQEPPVWQAAVALLMKSTHSLWWGWANVVSLFFFFSSLFPLYLLSRNAMSSRAAWWSLIFYLMQPLNIMLSGQAGVDSSCLAFVVWFVFFVDRTVNKPFSIINWMLTFVTAVIAITTKMPLFFSVCFACVYLFFSKGDVRSLKQWISWGVLGLLTVIIFLGWNAWCSRCYSNAIMPLVDLRLSHNPAMWDWYFGPWEFRLNIMNWVKGGWRFLNSLFGSAGIAALFIAALCVGKNRLAKCWLFSGVATVLVFTRLVLVHQHYYIIFSVPAAMLCAEAAVWVENKLFASGNTKKWCFELLLFGTLFVSSVQGLMGLEIVQNYDPYRYRIAKIIQTHTFPDDKLVVQSDGWGDYLLLTHRQGVMVENTKPLENPDNLNYLLQHGYNKLVLVSEPPLRNAVRQVNPGEAERKRIMHTEFQTSITTNWPVMFENEDIVIMEINETINNYPQS